MNPDYQRGIADSLKLLYHYINGLDHSTGFRASGVAQEHSQMLKELYNQLHGSLVK